MEFLYLRLKNQALLNTFHLNGHTLGFPPQTKKLKYNKQHQWKLPLCSFLLNGKTVGLHPQTQKLEPLSTA